MPILRTTRWTLKSRRKGRITLVFQATESAGAQALGKEDLPEGIDARLAGVSGTVDGEVELDLDAPLPVELRRGGRLTMRVEGRAGTRPFVLETRAHSSLSLARERKRKR